jgi:hypothetical protein
VISKRAQNFTWQAVAWVIEIALEYRWINHNPYTKTVHSQVGKVPPSASTKPGALHRVARSRTWGGAGAAPIHVTPM